MTHFPLSALAPNRTVLRAAMLVGFSSLALMCKGNKDDDSPPVPPGSTGGTGDMGGMGGMGTLDPCEDVSCPGGATCEAEGMSFACVCKSASCEGIPLCTPDSCHEDATCMQMDDGFTCSCDDGFSGNGFSCVEGDLCEALDCSGENSTCVTDGSVAACACRPGFEPVGGGNCADIDECEDVSSCGAGATCLNTAGSFVCDCDSGYEAQSNGTCAPAGGCSGSSACEDLGMDCLGVPGEVSCVCPGSEIGDGTYCKAAPDCDPGDCNTGTCLETAAGFACACPRGTTGEFCQDTTACSLDTVLNSESNPVVEDATLRRVLEDYAGVSGGTEITVGDLSAVSEIYVNTLLDGESKISSLAGLECLQNLLYLTLFNQNVSDISALAHHNSLVTLDLGCNPLTSIAPIAGKSSLRELYIDQESSSCTGTQAMLSSMSDIATLKNLRSLSVVGQGIDADPGFDGLPYLNYLNLSDNPLDALGELGTMPSLEYLDARGTGAASLSSLSAFPMLRDLNISGSDVASLSGIGSGANLRLLTAMDLGLTALSGVANADLLREIRVNGNSIASLAPLAGSGSLVRARVIDNDVASLEDFASADPLQFSGVLDLNGNPLDCEELEELEGELGDKGIFVNSDCF